MEFRLIPNANHTRYHFETDVLAGQLQPLGHRHGVCNLVHKPSGLSLVHPDFSLLNLYLIFTTGRCLASARAIRRTVTADLDAVHIQWAPTELHRAHIDLTYRIAAPNAIDMQIIVRAREVYPAYEGLVASYFDLALKPQIYVSKSDPYWFTPVVQHLYRDNALVFPRDAQTARLHLDGRWRNVRSIYQWKAQDYYAYPLMMQVHAERRIAVVLMSRAETCTSLAWTVGLADARVSSYGSDHLDDPVKARNPLYFNLFGGDFQPAETYTACLRLCVLDLNDDISEPLRAYGDYVAEAPNKKTDA